MNTNTNLSVLPDPTGLIDKVSNVVDNIYGYPDWLLVALGCLIVGFCLKRWSRFPNEAIPLVVILFGGVFMTLMAPEHPAKSSVLRWKATNFIVGIAIGAVVWLFHNKIWKGIVTRYPVLGSLTPSFNTETIPRPPLQPAPIPVADPSPVTPEKTETK